jgi:hypothetical protein
MQEIQTVVQHNGLNYTLLTIFEEGYYYLFVELPDEIDPNVQFNGNRKLKLERTSKWDVALDNHVHYARQLRQYGCENDIEIWDYAVKPRYRRVNTILNFSGILHYLVTQVEIKEGDFAFGTRYCYPTPSNNNEPDFTALANCELLKYTYNEKDADLAHAHFQLQAEKHDDDFSIYDFNVNYELNPIGDFESDTESDSDIEEDDLFPVEFQNIDQMTRFLKRYQNHPGLSGVFGRIDEEVKVEDKMIINIHESGSPQLNPIDTVGFHSFIPAPAILPDISENGEMDLVRNSTPSPTPQTVIETVAEAVSELKTVNPILPLGMNWADVVDDDDLPVNSPILRRLEKIEFPLPYQQPLVKFPLDFNISDGKVIIDGEWAGRLLELQPYQSSDQYFAIDPCQHAGHLVTVVTLPIDQSFGFRTVAYQFREGDYANARLIAEHQNERVARVGHKHYCDEARKHGTDWDKYTLYVTPVEELFEPEPEDSLGGPGLFAEEMY